MQVKIKLILSLLLVLLFVTACNNKKSDCRCEVKEQFKELEFDICVLNFEKEKKNLTIKYKMSIQNGENILKYGVPDANAYMQRIYYFSYLIEKDIWLEQNEKKIYCSGAVFERNYNLTNDVSFTLHFEDVEKSSSTLFCYNAQVFGLAPLKYKIKVK